MMQFFKDFFIPLLVTVVLHAVVVLVMVSGWESAPVERKVKRPNFVQAKLVTLESKKKQNNKKSTKKVKIIDLNKKRKEKERKKKKAAQKRKKEAKKKKEKDRKAKAKREAEQKRRKEEQLRKQRERQAFDQALLDEQMALAEESYATAAQSYMGAIAQRIEQNWSRPPSARNGMECELRIQLVPTGRVIGVDIIRGSGSVPFDRSAEQAVKKVEQFPEIKKMKPEVFERYYRELTLVFRPQDLRQ